jgi:hypothetical protein
MGQMEMKYIFSIEKKYNILAKATHVSDVAHGSLVSIYYFVVTAISPHSMYLDRVCGHGVSH